MTSVMREIGSKLDWALRCAEEGRAFDPIDRDSLAIFDQENRIRCAIDDLVEFLNVMGAD